MLRIFAKSNVVRYLGNVTFSAYSQPDVPLCLSIFVLALRFASRRMRQEVY
jgi:hypothetical protein